MGEVVGKFVDEHYKKIPGAFFIQNMLGEYHCSDCIHTELTSIPFSEEADMKIQLLQKYTPL